MALVPATRVGIDIVVRNAKAIAAFKDLSKSITGTKNSITNLSDKFRGFDRTLNIVALGVITAATVKFVKMAAELERAEIQIGVFEKSLDAVPAAMNSIIRLTDKVPFSINEMTKSFVRLKASGLEPISDAQGNGILKNIADGVAAFGGTSETFKRAIIGMQQIAGKGVVSMEELRQQIGEAIPTAMRVMAAEMGISVAKLITEVSKGRISAQEGLEALSEGLKRSFEGAGEVLKATFFGQIQELEKNIQLLAKTLVKDTGALSVFTAGLKILNEEIGIFIAFLKTSEGQVAIDSFTEGLIKMGNFLIGMIPPFKEFIKILISLVSTIAAITGALPPEIVGGGLLGFILFGSSGITPGVIFAIFSGEISSSFSFVKEAVQDIVGFFNNLGITRHVAGGLIGLYMFGPLGAIAGVATAFFSDIGRDIGKGGKDLQDTSEEAGTRIGLAIGEGMDSGLTPVMTSVEERLRAAMATLKFITGKKVGQDPQDIGGLDPTEIAQFNKINKFIEALEIKVSGAGNALQTFAAKVGVKLEELGEIIGTVTKRLDELPAGSTKVAGLKQELIDLGNRGADLVKLRDAWIQLNLDKIFLSTGFALDKMKLSMQEFLVGTGEAMTSTEIAVARTENRFGSFRVGIESLRRQIQKLTVDSVEYKIRTEELENAERLLEIAQRNAVKTTKELAAIRQEAAIQSAEMAAKQSKFAVGKFLGGNFFDAVAEAGFKAELEILRLEKQIARSMKKIKSDLVKGDISEAVAKRSLESLQASADLLAENSEAFIEKMKFQASDVGILMTDIANNIEGAFARSFEGIIRGTKSAKDVLLDFYDAITAAVIKYLAKQAVVGLLGKDSSGGGGLGGIIFGGLSALFGGPAIGATSGNTFGGFQGFNKGGTFNLNGKGGIDNNLLSMNGAPFARVSAGETISVNPVGETGGGDVYQINITAMDGADVRRVFDRHGAEIIQSLNSRGRINRGLDRTL